VLHSASETAPVWPGRSQWCCKIPHQWQTEKLAWNYAFSWSRPRCRWLHRTPPWHCDASAGASPSITFVWGQAILRLVRATALFVRRDIEACAKAFARKAHRHNWPETNVGAGLPAKRRAGGARSHTRCISSGKHLSALLRSLSELAIGRLCAGFWPISARKTFDVINQHSSSNCRQFPKLALAGRIRLRHRA
jgi:hypothetical protein